MRIKAVVYSRVSTEEQNPKAQLEVVLQYAQERGYEVVKIFEEQISGSTDPLERPVFKELLKFVKENDIGAIILYDLTRFYRAASPTQALNKLRQIMDEYEVFFDFAREPEIEDPLFREFWMFVKSWFASYERLQISLRTKYGLMRLKKEGKLYHKPSIVYYYAAWLYDKDFSELTKEELESAKKQLVKIVKKYWNNPAVKKTKIGELLKQNELREMYIRFPKAPDSYFTWRRLIQQ